MKQNILIVDDSATARALFKACVADEKNYEILEASNWQDAIALASSKIPVLVILDYNMPGKLGPEIAALIREKGINTKFVLMSANTQASVIEEVRNLGFCDVLEKPISAESVQTMLEKLL